ncbi:MAG: flavohemoglobin expression-modulating QEGLA motif protein [Desulfobacula sp.]|nr:flavohemoglobin expression-modulating QEGLA motif protein [Desulfobacula sp.]
MQTISEQACIDAIQNEVCFHANVVGGAFSLKIETYGFFICAAIHNGHNLRKDLAGNCQLSQKERFYEEDPYTGEFIHAMPIALIANDSRYEYDLNRFIEESIYETAWGKTVWKKKISKKNRKVSHGKYRAFYRVLKALVKKTEEKHGACLLYDIHSYNYKRIKAGPTPVFNIGTHKLNRSRWDSIIKHWEKTLNTCSLPSLECSAASDVVFQGKGYLSTYIRDNFKNTLVLPTDIKKIFMDEENTDVYHLVLSELREIFKQAVLDNALFFSQQHTRKHPAIKTVLLSETIEPAVLKVDRALYRLCKGIETLVYINPKNLIGEKKRFYASKYNYNPKFTYHQLNFNPAEFREKLYRLPVDKIKDISIQKLYRNVINAYSKKIDMLVSVGSENFLYNSLLYYGQPNREDIKVAHFLLFAKDFEEFEKPAIRSDIVQKEFRSAMKVYGFKCRVEVSSKIIASAMVNNAKKTVLINKSERFSRIQTNALIHHELGVHMLTTVNSDQQQLKVFKLGLPGNTYSQEGLAVLSEYMTGNLYLERLKTLALRVIAVRMMVKNYDFGRTFKILRQDFNLGRDAAFKITARVYRGGGYTKDFCYLRGFRDALRLFQNCDLRCLFIGKTSFDYIDVINEMMERKMVGQPGYLPLFFQKGQRYPGNKILDYLIRSVY